MVVWGLRALGVLVPGGRRAVAAGADGAPRPSVPGAAGLPPGRRSPSAIDRARVLARFALVQEGSYFQLLGVRPSESGHEIRRAYEALRREFAADRFDASVSAELAPEIAAIQEAFDEGMRVLGDDELRRRYQEHLVD
jgi:hypothetical protein